MQCEESKIQTDYGEAVVRAAESTLGVRERTRNRGPEVDDYLRSVGLDPAGRYPWCMAWVYSRYLSAAVSLGRQTSCPRTAGAVRSWVLASRRRLQTIRPEDVVTGAAQLRPGDQFIRVRLGHVEDVAKAKNGRIVLGHTGIVAAFAPHAGTIHTIEGNTNAAGSREGDGVYRKTLAIDAPELVGFVRHVAFQAEGARRGTAA